MFYFTLLLAMQSLQTVMAQQNIKKSLTEKQQSILQRFLSEFVEITPGKGKFPREFQMGRENGPRNEKPAHSVIMSRDFAMAKYEVTQELYEFVDEKNPSRWKGSRNAAESMSFQEAVRFCQKLTRILHSQNLIKSEFEIRLPNEAEWEYCCRAGSKTLYSFGDLGRTSDDKRNKATILARYAWHTGNAAGNDPAVGVLKPNNWGLYDMHGYLWEFVSDSWHQDYRKAPHHSDSWDPNKKHVPRVLRGGSWRDRYDLLTSSTRQAIPDHAKSDAIGIRCVKSRRIRKKQ